MQWQFLSNASKPGILSLEDKAESILERALPLRNLKFNVELLKGHQGQDQGHQRPWPSCNSRPVHPQLTAIAETEVASFGPSHIERSSNLTTATEETVKLSWFSGSCHPRQLLQATNCSVSYWTIW